MTTNEEALMDGGTRGALGWARGLEARRRLRWLWGLVAVVALLDLARVVLAQAQRDAFVLAYGLSQRLDMRSFLGQEIAKREAPGHLNASLFSLLCALAVLALLGTVRRGAPWARNVAAVLLALSGLNTLAYIAVPAPWWDQAMAVAVVLLSVLAGLLLWHAPLVADAQERRDARVLGR